MVGAVICLLFRRGVGGSNPPGATTNFILNFLRHLLAQSLKEPPLAPLCMIASMLVSKTEGSGHEPEGATNWRNSRTVG